MWDGGEQIGTLRAGRVRFERGGHRLVAIRVSIDSRPSAIWTLLTAQMGLPGLSGGGKRSPAEKGVTELPYAFARSSPSPAPGAVRGQPSWDLGFEVAQAARHAETEPSPSDIDEPAGPSSAGDGSIQISAMRFVGDTVSRSGWFEGLVRLRWGPLTLACERLAMDHETGPSGGVSRLVATGDVTFERGPWKGRAGKVSYDPAAGRLTMEEQPTLTDGTDSMTGSRIVLDMETGRVECERCRVRWTLDGP